ncbi:hypothetical protein Q3G72_035279 [Acer saccharum]|nr:hypothetical protein Q3G72_035279 [Acer saccharum]
MASAGWNDRQRRVHTGGQGINFAQPSKRSYVDILDSRVPCKGGYGEERHDNQRKVEEMKQVFWEGSSEGQKWLNKCAVGTLRRFDKVSRVNRELQNRGIAFKASYLGDKFILWRFEDEQTCLSFIKNRSAWEDNFSSMSQWRATTVAKMKPRLQKGRLLILLDLRTSCAKKIKVEDQRGVFWLTVEEEGAPANVLWVEDFLDLAEGVSMSDLREPPISDFERQSPTPISDFERQSHGVGGDNRGWQMVSQDRAKAKQVGSYGVASGSQINVRDKRKLSQLDSRKGVSNDFLKKDKGKQRFSKPFHRHLPPIPFSNSKPVKFFEKKSQVDCMGRSSSSSSSSSDASPFNNSVKSKRECSHFYKSSENLVSTGRGVEPVDLEFSFGECHLGQVNMDPDRAVSVSEAQQIEEEGPIKEIGEPN